MSTQITGDLTWLMTGNLFRYNYINKKCDIYNGFDLAAIKSG